MIMCNGAEEVGQAAEPTQSVSMVVHDLRVQVGVVLGYSQLILDETEGSLDPEHREFLRLILSAARSLNRLINEHLGASVPEHDPSKRRTAVYGQAAAQQGGGAPCATASSPEGPTAQEGPLA